MIDRDTNATRTEDRGRVDVAGTSPTAPEGGRIVLVCVRHLIINYYNVL